MANITIHDLDDDVAMRLRARAAEHHRSMEEEARIILRDAVAGGRAGPRNLATFTRECFASLGGVELELPPRSGRRRSPGWGPDLDDSSRLRVRRRMPSVVGDAFWVSLV